MAEIMRDEKITKLKKNTNNIYNCKNCLDKDEHDNKQL